MKKISLILAIILLLFCVSCTKNESAWPYPKVFYNDTELAVLRLTIRTNEDEEPIKETLKELISMFYDDIPINVVDKWESLKGTSEDISADFTVERTFCGIFDSDGNIVFEVAPTGDASNNWEAKPAQSVKDDVLTEGKDYVVCSKDYIKSKNGEWTEEYSVAIIRIASPDETYADVEIEWPDFILIDGVVFENDAENPTTLKKSELGIQIGEVEHLVPTKYRRIEELYLKNMADFTASICPIGSKIYKVKDSSHIAVLVNGEYILYKLGQ